jgi:hypothetical protein
LVNSGQQWALLPFPATTANPSKDETMRHALIVKHYAIAALWASTGDDDEPLDASYSLDDISPETWGKMSEDVLQFIKQNEALLLASGQSDEQIGHDFWLTRNRHGAGFWDRGLGEVGDKLTQACKSFGEVWPYVGDDGRIHMM